MAYWFTPRTADWKVMGSNPFIVRFLSIFSTQTGSCLQVAVLGPNGKTKIAQPNSFHLYAVSLHFLLQLPGQCNRFGAS